METEIDRMLALAARSRGWTFRECPPQFARLRGGCTLIVVPPWLWRPRVRCVTDIPRGELVPLVRRKVA